MRVAKKFFSFLLAVVLMGTSVFPAAAFEKPENAETALQGGYASTRYRSQNRAGRSRSRKTGGMPLSTESKN